MHVKSFIGSGLSALLRYVRGQGKDENGKSKPATNGNGRARSLGGQGFGFDPITERQVDIARRVMEYTALPPMQGNKTKFVDKDVLHASLSWAPGQKPDDAEKAEAARTYLKAIGMEKARAMFFEHDDKSYPHIHIAASRIDPDGMAYPDRERFHRGAHWAIEWERRKQQVTKVGQWRHDIADATRGQVDQERLKELAFKREATVTKGRLDLYFAFGGRFGPRMEAAREQFVSSQDLLRLKKYISGKTAAYTTKEMWQEEARTLAMARNVRNRTGFEVPDATIDKISKDMTLTAQQKEVFRHATRDNGLSMITGEAGTGKSHVGIAIRKAYEAHGFKVKGLAFTNKVVQNLQKDGFDSATIASEVARLKGGKYKWDEKTVLALDEAAQVSTPDMKQLMGFAQSQGPKMIPIGHDKQLGSIDRGGIFPVMARQMGTGRLTEVMRNKDPDQQRAWKMMADRKFKPAVNIFKKSDSIRWHDTKEESLKALAKQYADDYRADPKAQRQIVATTNDEVRTMNEFVRGLWKQDGRIGQEAQFDTAKGPRKFGVGDRVLMNETPNQEDKKKGLINGAFGYVRGISTLPNGKQEMDVEIDREEGQQRRLFKFPVGLNKDEGDVSGIDHGWAGTVYKSQGSTIDKTYMVHNPIATAPTNYVALTRHRDKTKLYVTREETASFDDLAAQLKHGSDKTSAHAYYLDDSEKAKLQSAPYNKTIHSQQKLNTAPKQEKKMDTPTPTPEVLQPRELEKARDKSKEPNPFDAATPAMNECFEKNQKDYSAGKLKPNYPPPTNTDT